MPLHYGLASNMIMEIQDTSNGIGCVSVKSMQPGQCSTRSVLLTDGRRVTLSRDRNLEHLDTRMLSPKRMEQLANRLLSPDMKHRRRILFEDGICYDDWINPSAIHLGIGLFSIQERHFRIFQRC